MKVKSYLSIIIAGILWGCISLFVKQLNAYGFSAMQVSATRCILTAILMLIYILITNPSALKIRLKDIWVFVGTGIISLTLFNCCYFYTIEKSQASIAVVLLYTSPIFVMLFSALLFKEKITLKKIISLILCFSGCVLVAGLVQSEFSISPGILTVGICSGIFYALYSVFGIFALRKYDTLTVTLYTFIFAAIANIIIGKPLDIIEKTIANPILIPYEIGIAVLCTLLPYLLYTYGLKETPAAKAAILVTTEPLVGALIGIFIFSDPYNIDKILGIALIFAAVILLSVNPFEKRGSHEK